jgi:hypothetical protein
MHQALFNTVIFKKKKFFTLLDDLAPILTIFLLKMQKSRKSAHPTIQHFNKKKSKEKVFPTRC